MSTFQTDNTASNEAMEEAWANAREIVAACWPYGEPIAFGDLTVTSDAGTSSTNIIFSHVNSAGEFTHIGRVISDIMGSGVDRNAEEGHFAASSPLRDEEDQDRMGLETDPGEMGAAESWFRRMRDE